MAGTCIQFSSETVQTDSDSFVLGAGTARTDGADMPFCRSRGSVMVHYLQSNTDSFVRSIAPFEEAWYS